MSIDGYQNSVKVLHRRNDEANDVSINFFLIWKETNKYPWRRKTKNCMKITDLKASPDI